MKVVQPSVELEFITPNALELIERAGRICYQSESRGDPEAFIRKILKLGHESVIEHAYASFRIICDRGVCYSADTDVLTNEGWRPWPDICGDELFATLTPEHRVEFHRASGIIREEFDGYLYRLSTSMINLCVTPAHSMYVQKHDTRAARRKEEPWQLIPAEEIVGKRVSYKRDAVLRGVGPTEYSIEDFVTTQGNRHGGIQNHTRSGRTFTSKVFAKFLGYWLAEGSLDHTDGSSYQITLFQNVGPVLQDMLSVLTEMGYTPAVKDNGSEINKEVSVCDAALYAYLKPYHGSFNKRVPRDVLSTFSGGDLLELILAHVAGDGSVHHANQHMQAYTTSRGLADDLQEAALYAGISATVWIDDRTGKNGGLRGIVHRRPCYVVSYVTAKNTPLVNHGGKCFKGIPHESWAPYVGTVYCATVPNHTLYVRRNGRPCWSGNSHELVRHRICSFSQSSTRYCNYSKERFGGHISVIIPEQIKNHPLLATKWIGLMEVIDAFYNEMTHEGVAPQIARSVLPNALQTELMMTANFREWRHFLKLRTSPKAHPQMIEVASQIGGILLREYPAIFEDCM